MTDQQRKKAAPGWYPHPSMAQTRRYWDGQRWTDDIAPAATPPHRQAGALTIARGVALGLVSVLAGIWFLYSCQASGDDLDCARYNAERVTQGLPERPC